MSTQIKNLILHKLNCSSEGESIVSLRDLPLEITQVNEEFVNKLHTIYRSKQSKGFCLFSHDSEFKNQLLKYQNGEDSFCQLSHQITKEFNCQLNKYGLSSQGVVIVGEYTNLVTDYLFIALLQSSETIKITDQLNIGSTDHLDLGNLQIAAQIDLSMMRAEPDSNRYISYIKGRTSNKLKDLFLEVFGATEGLNTKSQNKTLIGAIEDFCKTPNAELSAQDYRSEAFKLCNNNNKENEDIDIKVISDHFANIGSGESFYDFVGDQGYELEDKFPVDKTVIKKLTKLSGQGGGITINFDSDLLGGRVTYNQETDILSFSPPPNLREALLRRNIEK